MKNMKAPSNQPTHTFANTPESMPTTVLRTKVLLKFAKVFVEEDFQRLARPTAEEVQTRRLPGIFANALCLCPSLGFQRGQQPEEPPQLRVLVGRGKHCAGVVGAVASFTLHVHNHMGLPGTTNHPNVIDGVFGVDIDIDIYVTRWRLLWCFCDQLWVFW